jgi:trans-aconitate 2-methyltransferase
MGWDPAQYLQFGNERLRPALDLLSHVSHPNPKTVVDLGCGAGNVTKHLRSRWPEARLIAVDNSKEMLARASGALPEVDLVEADASSWVPEAPVDVLFANAVLHWLPDHDALFPRLLGYVADAGVFAVQMPRNFHAPSHTSLRETVRDGPWLGRLEPLLKDTFVGEPTFYYEILSGAAASLDIWETEYVQALTGPNPVAEYGKGSWLRPFLNALDEPDRTRFEEHYRRRVLERYPPRSNGTTLFPFRRLFIIATARIRGTK